MVATVKRGNPTATYDVEQGQHVITVPYECVGTLIELDPIAIFNHPSIPQQNEPYKDKNGGEHDAYLKNLAVDRPKRKGNEARVIVTATFRSPKQPEGETSTDPTKWAPEIDTNEITEDFVVADLPFLGAWQDINSKPCDPTKPDPPLFDINNDACQMLKPLPLVFETNLPEPPKIYPIQNSVGQPFEPVPITVSYVEYIITFRRNKWEPNSDERKFEKFLDRLNLTKTTVEIPEKNFKIIAEPYTLWLKGVTPRMASTTNETGVINYWEIDYRLAYKADGWYEDVANKGTTRILTAGGPDGRGGTNSYSSPSEIPAGMPLQVAVKEDDGHTVSKPVWLDKDGEVDTSFNRCYLRYLRRCTANFNDDKLGLVNWKQVT